MQSDVQFFNRISHFAWHFVTFTVYMLLDFNVFSVYMHYAFIRFIFFGSLHFVRMHRYTWLAARFRLQRNT